jgi:hypothetical protein
MQPRHVPTTTFPDWSSAKSSASSPGSIAALSPSDFFHSELSQNSEGHDDAALLAARMLTAARSASPLVVPSNATPVPSVPAPEAVPATDASKVSLKTCGDLCDRHGCRRMLAKHLRRLVCVKCMPENSYKVCACGKCIHTLCIQEGDLTQNWECTDCTAKSQQHREGETLCLEHAFSVHGFLMSCCVWNMLSVYTVSSCSVVYGTCFQCTRFPYVVLCMEHAFSARGVVNPRCREGCIW